MYTILQILQWAIPSGGIGAAIGWIANRKVHKAKTAKAVHDTYKAMYEDISRVLEGTQKNYEETQNKYEKIQKLFEEASCETADLRRAVNRLQRTITIAKRCNHYDSCPIRDELQDSGDSDTKHNTNPKDTDSAGTTDGQCKPRDRIKRKQDITGCCSGHGTTGSDNAGT